TSSVRPRHGDTHTPSSPSTLWADLHCPYCGGELRAADTVRDAGDSAIVHCDCGRWPVIEGILVLRAVPDEVLRLIESGDLNGALRAALHVLEHVDTRTRARRRLDGYSHLGRPMARLLERVFSER